MVKCLDWLESITTHSVGELIMGLLIRTALESTLIEAGVDETPWLPATAKIWDTITTSWMVEAMKFMMMKGLA
jgi:hypothetical protein